MGCLVYRQYQVLKQDPAILKTKKKKVWITRVTTMRKEVKAIAITIAMRKLVVIRVTLVTGVTGVTGVTKVIRMKVMKQMN